MQGTPEDCGIMARAIDVVFNSIGDNLVMKRVIIPDGFNPIKLKPGPGRPGLNKKFCQI